MMYCIKYQRFVVASYVNVAYVNVKNYLKYEV